MPQEFQVLQCFSCKTFQVHQVKKALKWACKLCGGKQSVIKVYGRGTGAECRQHVQRLNTMRGELDDALQCQPHGVNEVSSGIDDWVQQDTVPVHTRLEQPALSSHVSTKLETGDGEKAPARKWEQFIEEDLTSTQEDEETSLDSNIVYTTDASLFNSHNRKRKSNSKAANTSKRAKATENSNIQHEESHHSWSNSSTRVDKYHNSSFETQDTFRENQNSGFVQNEFVPSQRATKTVEHSSSLGVSSENTNSKWGAYITDQLQSEALSEEEEEDYSQYQSTDSYGNRMNQSLSGGLSHTNRADHLGLYSINREEEEQNMGRYTVNLEQDNRDLEGTKRNNVVCKVRKEEVKKPVSVNASKWNKFLSFENENQTDDENEQAELHVQRNSDTCSGSTVPRHDPTTYSTPELVNTTELTESPNSLLKEKSDRHKDVSVLKNLKNLQKPTDSKCLSYVSQHKPSPTQNNKNSAILKSLYTLDNLNDEDLDF